MEAADLKLLQKIKIGIWITIIGLVLNGLSAFTLRPELEFALRFKSIMPDEIYSWLLQVQSAVTETIQRFPFMLYGYDWLGFAHFLIAIAFIGALRNPVKNEWIVQFGMIAAFLSIIMALVFERFRGIPFSWSLIDVLVGALAFLVLYFCNKWIQEYKLLSR